MVHHCADRAAVTGRNSSRTHTCVPGGDFGTRLTDGERTSQSGNGAQVELGANYVVGDVEFFRGASNKPALDQYAHVFMNSLDVSLKLTRQSSDAARPELLQPLDIREKSRTNVSTSLKSYGYSRPSI